MPNPFTGAETQVARRIAAAPLVTEPFEHCVVDDVLPAAVFDAIHDNWPDDQVMMALPETGRTTSDSGKYRERQVMLLENRFFEAQPKEAEEFWVNVAFAVMSAAVITACYEKFRSVLDARVAHLKISATLMPEMLVVSDRSNYRIGPHTDSKARFMSLLYYLSPDPKYRSYGTGLYTPKDPALPLNDLKHHDVEDFDLHTRVDYKPNRLVVFPRTDRSYHGVEPVPVEDCDRRLLIVNVRAPEGAR